MKKRIYAVRDEKAECFGNPFYMGNDGEALRAFSDGVKDSKSALAAHPADYRLYRLGEFDDCSGDIVGLSTPHFLAVASDFAAVAAV